jgi:Domain of unknown function (DUF4412)
MTRPLTRAAAFAALALAFAAPLAAQELPTAKTVLDRYVEAVGGRGLIGRFQTRHSVMEMSMPAMGMTMSMETFNARPNRMLVKMEMPGLGAMTSGYDGQVAWSNNPMQGPRIIEGEELKQTLQSADFDASLDYARSYSTMETVGRGEVGGRPCWRVKMVHTSGVEVINCFDVENGLLVGATATQVSNMGAVQAEMTFSDYKDFDGFKMPTRMTTRAMGQEMVMTIKSVSHEPLDPSVFALPAEIRALTGNRN